jgi:hypothetical protein
MTNPIRTAFYGLLFAIPMYLFFAALAYYLNLSILFKVLFVFICIDAFFIVFCGTILLSRKAFNQRSKDVYADRIDHQVFEYQEEQRL